MTKNELKALSNNTFYDNNSGEITPQKHRAFNDAMIDTMVAPTDIPEGVVEESGSWTPSPSGNYVISSASGVWSRIGKMVFISGTFYYGGSVSSITIAGLPRPTSGTSELNAIGQQDYNLRAMAVSSSINFTPHVGATGPIIGGTVRFNGFYRMQ